MDKRKLFGWELKQKRLRKEEQLKSKQTSLENFFLKPRHDKMGDESPIIQDQEAESESLVQTVHSGNKSKSTSSNSSNPIKTIQTVEKLIETASTSVSYFSFLKREGTGEEIYSRLGNFDSLNLNTF